MAVLVSRFCDALYLISKVLSAAHREQVSVVEFAWIEMSTGPQVMDARVCDGEFFLKV